jgi:hypothetical protein
MRTRRRARLHSPLAKDVRVPGIIGKQRPAVPSLVQIERLPRERERKRQRETERKRQKERINGKRNSREKISSSVFQDLRKGCRIRGE